MNRHTHDNQGKPVPFPTAEREFEKAAEMPQARVDRAAKDAARALDGSEAKSLREAEERGKARLQEEDPQLYERAQGLEQSERRELYQRAAERVADGWSWRDAVNAEMAAFKH